jgi:hypothetical protein
LKEEVPKKSFIIQRIDKTVPGVAQEQYYLNQLKKRIDKTEHLKTFQKFINFCDNIRQNFR